MVKFEDINSAEIKQYLNDKYKDLTFTQSIIDAASGSIGKAEALKDKQELFDTINGVMANIEKLDLIDTLKNANTIYKSQEDKNEILEYINIVLLKKAKEDIRYINTIKIVEEAKRRLQANSNYNMTIDNMIISIWEEIH